MTNSHIIDDFSGINEELKRLRKQEKDNKDIIERNSQTNDSQQGNAQSEDYWDF